ncbi:hypothetical protein HYV57_05615 [Candidatus Peregrinibacteria bacterium]|nr:hypothetical protein [Candidatus Peregrinibacteria bacterium]
MIIKLINIFSTTTISSRESVKELIKKLKKDDEIILDFSKIEFISRSVAHELLKLKEKHSNMRFSNMAEEVSKMVRLVAANIAYPQKNTEEFKPKKTTLSSVLRR